MTVRRLRPHAATISSEVSRLATRFRAINLCQGFPDTDGPESMIEAAVRAMREGHNQYPPGIGTPELRRAAVDHETAHTGLVHDPDTEVLVTVGATEAIASAVVGLVEYDDEVVVIEPYYDSYAATVALAGATRRAARMIRSGGEFRLDVDSLRDAFSPRTRAVLVNTPHNPTGSVLPREDLEQIAALCHEFDAIATLRQDMQARRDQLADTLPGVGFDLVVVQGTYFVTADPRPLGVTDVAAWWLELPERIGVAAVPFAPFTDAFSGDWAHLVRFAFCKRPEVLAEAGRRLRVLQR